MDQVTTDGLLGIDGGGTSCRAALLWRGKRFEARSGSANVTSDFKGAILAISDVVRDVALQARLSLPDLMDIPAHLGLAGATTPEICAKVIASLPLTKAAVSDDQMTTLVGALVAEDGALVSVGTGSFLASQKAGQRRFLGGHGLALGDEASGAWLGRALLARILHSLDGLVPHSALTQDVFSAFNQEAGAISLFAASASPGRYGHYAPMVVSAAEAGDEAAVVLMQAGAGYILAGLKSLNWQQDEALCLMGSLGSFYLPYLPQPVRDSVRPAKASALDGALTLAAQCHATSSSVATRT
jgi:glucosamine kinase